MTGVRGAGSDGDPFFDAVSLAPICWAKSPNLLIATSIASAAQNMMMAITTRVLRDEAPVIAKAKRS